MCMISIEIIEHAVCFEEHAYSNDPSFGIKFQAVMMRLMC